MLGLCPILLDVQMSQRMEVAAGPIFQRGHIAGNGQSRRTGGDLRVGECQRHSAVLVAGEDTAGRYFQPQKIPDRTRGCSARQVGRRRIDHALDVNVCGVFQTTIERRTASRTAVQHAHAGKIGRAIQGGDRGLRELQIGEGIGVPECRVRRCGRALDLVEAMLKPFCATVQLEPMVPLARVALS